MSSLSIGIGVRGDGKDSSPGMVAEIERLDAGRDRQRRTTSVAAGEPRLIDDVAPGLWEVRVVTPAGRVLTQEVEVPKHGGASAQFDISVRTARGDRSAYNEGVVPVAANAGGVTKGIVGVDSTVISDVMSGIGAATFGGRGLGRVRALAPKPDVEARVVPVRRPDSEAAVVAAWSRIAEALSKGVPPAAFWADGREARVSSAGSGVDGARLWSVEGQDEARTFALAGSRRRLHVVPVPWRTNDHKAGALVSSGSAAVPGGSRVVVSDPAFAGLLSYLSHGAVVTAAELISADDTLRPYGDDGPTGMLRGKRACPLGACVAAYALIGTAVPGSMASWHPWVGNLRRWFGWLPDGAVLDARLRLLTARTEEDVAAVLPILREALVRGVPFYSQGFDWLLQAMLQFPDEALFAKVQPFVSRVAASLDAAEVFTTFDLGADR